MSQIHTYSDRQCIQSLREQSSQCFIWAKELSGKPDSVVLLRIAHEFDAIAMRSEKRVPS